VTSPAQQHIVSPWMMTVRSLLTGQQQGDRSLDDLKAPNKVKDLGKSKVAGTREMGDLGEGRGVWPTEMKDFEEERCVQVNLVPL